MYEYTYLTTDLTVPPSDCESCMAMASLNACSLLVTWKSKPSRSPSRTIDKIQTRSAGDALCNSLRKSGT